MSGLKFGLQLLKFDMLRVKFVLRILKQAVRSPVQGVRWYKGLLRIPEKPARYTSSFS